MGRPRKCGELLHVRGIRATEAQWRRWAAEAERRGYRTVQEWIREKLDLAARKGL